LHEFQRLCDEPVPHGELKRAKDHLTGKLLLGLETSDELAMYYGGQEVVHEPIVGPADLMRRIEAVGADDIQNVARDIFSDARLNLALIGPKTDREELYTHLTLAGS
ncbi:MAG: insulinase family protein, partial [Candidatus Colwellbacteria bacterium]|nr:insulinase family protein [Candidatus Colwellbacteria bacterium]